MAKPGAKQVQREGVCVCVCRAQEGEGHVAKPRRARASDVPSPAGRFASLGPAWRRSAVASQVFQIHQRPGRARRRAVAHGVGWTFVRSLVRSFLRSFVPSTVRPCPQLL